MGAPPALGATTVWNISLRLLYICSGIPGPLTSARTDPCVTITAASERQRADLQLGARVAGEIFLGDHGTAFHCILPLLMQPILRPSAWGSSDHRCSTRFAYENRPEQASLFCLGWPKWCDLSCRWRWEGPVSAVGGGLFCWLPATWTDGSFIARLPVTNWKAWSRGFTQQLSRSRNYLAWFFPEYQIPG